MLEFITCSPGLKPNKIPDDEDKNKSSIELSLPKLLLIANKKMSIYSSASIAALNVVRRQISVNVLLSIHLILLPTCLTEGKPSPYVYLDQDTGTT